MGARRSRRSSRRPSADQEPRGEHQDKDDSLRPDLPIGDVRGDGSPLSPDSSIEVYVEERPGGYLRIGLRGLDADQTFAAKQGRPAKVDKSAELPLLDNVGRFEWRFYDPRANQWLNYWKEQQGKPLFAELNLALDDGAEVRAVFWIPPVARGAGTGNSNQPPVGPPAGSGQENTPGVPLQVQPLPGGGAAKR